MFYWIVYNICWDTYFLSFSLPFFPCLSSSFFPSFLPFFPQVFAWLDLSWNKSNSTQGWILSSQDLIPFLISSIGINFLFPLLDLPQFYQCFWFTFSKKQLLFYYPNKFYFCCFLFFCFNSYIPSSFFRIFFYNLVF